MTSNENAICEARTVSGRPCKNATVKGASFCRVHIEQSDIEELKSDYEKAYPSALRFADSLRQQIEKLISSHELSLGVPIECRVKSWESLDAKLTRKGQVTASVLEMDDLIGVRVILLFQRDLAEMHRFLIKELNVISYENTGTRLQEMQFGYQSVHYIVTLPDKWLSVPTLAEFKGMRAELQVRTLSQHIWAAASQKLQYKNEQSVPIELRRSIYRISAILETVDLEFERLLGDRDAYLKQTEPALEDIPLNVDLLRKILSEEWPSRNFKRDEEYSTVLRELDQFGVCTGTELRDLIKSHRTCAMRQEREQLKLRRNEIAEGDLLVGCDVDRIGKGVYFTHVGLTRAAMQCKDSEKFFDIVQTILSKESHDELWKK